MKKEKPVLNKELEARKQKKPLWKKWWFWIVAVLGVMILFSIIQQAIFGPPKDSEPSPSPSLDVVAEAATEQPAAQQEVQAEAPVETVSEETAPVVEEAPAEAAAPGESHIYDRAEVRDVVNGTRDAKIGEYSVIFTTSAECTIDALSDWYYNYVEQNDFNWCMIILTDEPEYIGYYSGGGLVSGNIVFEQDEYVDYELAESPAEVIYFPQDGTLVEAPSDDE